MPTTRQMLAAITSTVLLGWALGLFYRYLGQITSPSWLSIAIFHSILATIIYRYRHVVDSRKRLVVALLPALTLILACFLFCLASRSFIQPAPHLNFETPSFAQWAFVLWIPVIEELVFRAGVGDFMRRKVGTVLGSYCSALLFALAHGSGTLDGFGLPALVLGPLLLGLIAEWIYVQSGRLLASMALHSAANASILIFQSLDPRWLEWLKQLYMQT